MASLFLHVHHRPLPRQKRQLLVSSAGRRVFISPFPRASPYGVLLFRPHSLGGLSRLSPHSVVHAASPGFSHAEDDSSSTAPCLTSGGTTTHMEDTSRCAGIFWDLDNVPLADNSGPEAAAAQTRLFQAMTLAAGDDVRLVQCTAVCNFSTLVGMSAHEVNALLDTGCSLVVTPVVPQAADDAIIEAVHSFANEYRTKGVVTVVSSDSDMVVALSLATDAGCATLSIAQRTPRKPSAGGRVWRSARQFAKRGMREPDCVAFFQRKAVSPSACVACVGQASHDVQAALLRDASGDDEGRTMLTVPGTVTVLDGKDVSWRRPAGGVGGKPASAEEITSWLARCRSAGGASIWRPVAPSYAFETTANVADSGATSLAMRKAMLRTGEWPVTTSAKVRGGADDDDVEEEERNMWATAIDAVVQSSSEISTNDDLSSSPQSRKPVEHESESEPEPEPELEPEGSELLPAARRPQHVRQGRLLGFGKSGMSHVRAGKARKKRELRLQLAVEGILRAHPDGLPAEDLAAQFEERFGLPLEARALGFASPRALASALRKVALRGEEARGGGARGMLHSPTPGWYYLRPSSASSRTRRAVTADATAADEASARAAAERVVEDGGQHQSLDDPPPLERRDAEYVSRTRYARRQRGGGRGGGPPPFGWSSRAGGVVEVRLSQHGGGTLPDDFAARCAPYIVRRDESAKVRRERRLLEQEASSSSPSPSS